MVVVRLSQFIIHLCDVTCTLSEEALSLMTFGVTSISVFRILWMTRGKFYTLSLEGNAGCLDSTKLVDPNVLFMWVSGSQSSLCVGFSWTVSEQVDPPSVLRPACLDPLQALLFS